MAKKKSTSKGRQEKKPKPQINVRMEQELYDLIAEDAAAGERKLPAQVRLVLKQYYKDRLESRRGSES